MTTLRRRFDVSRGGARGWRLWSARAIHAPCRNRWRRQFSEHCADDDAESSVGRHSAFRCAASPIELASVLDGRKQRRLSRLRAGDRALIAWGVKQLAGAVLDGRTRLAPAPLIAAAVKATRLDATPLTDPRLVEALAALTTSLEGEASLTPFGRVAAGWDLQRMLSTLLILTDVEQADPTILARPLAPPIFIAGLPRSGTTFLHGLLAEDPANRAPRMWEAIYPCPGHRAAGLGAGRLKAQIELGVFTRLSPGIMSVHPTHADAPQECSEFASHVFRSPRFDAVYRAPSYHSWLDLSGYDEGYRFEARFLRHLQGQAATPRRWVLKSPDHVFSAYALARVFPDAMLVFVHRDPGHALASAARLTELLRAPFTAAIDRREIGRKVVGYWQTGMRRMATLADDPSFPLRSRLVHVEYRSLVSDPLGTVARIYEAFSLYFSPEARAAMAAKIARAPNGGYGANLYRPEDFGIDQAQERKRASVYVERFGVASPST